MIGGQFLLDRLKGALLQVFTVDVAPVPDAGQVGHLDLIQEVLRQRMAYLKRHAALAQQYQGCQQDQDDNPSFEPLLLLWQDKQFPLVMPVTASLGPPGHSLCYDFASTNPTIS